MKRIGTFASVLAVMALLLSASFSFAQDKPAKSKPAGSPEDLVGKPAPDFTLQTLDGEEVKLSDQKGKVVLIDFWATWCPPCREGLPHIQKLSQDKSLTDKGLVVWAVNAREGKDKIEPFMKQNSFSFAVPMDKNGAAMKDYNVRGIPTTLVIGRDGTVKKAFVGFGGEESAKKIHEAVETAVNESQPT